MTHCIMSGYGILAYLVSLVPPQRARLTLPDGLATGRAYLMAAIAPITVVPHTRIDNTIIANMAEIGVYCYAVYSAIKMHLNQATGACFPSYATIARITGIHRSTVIACVKKLQALQLLSPHWRFKDDGSHASNQYDFQAAGKAGATTQGTEHAVPSQHPGAEASVPAKKTAGEVQTGQGSRPEQPPVVGQDDHPSRPERPEQSEGNKKTRTIEDVDLMLTMPTAKQQTCSHPVTEIVFLRDDVVVCNHCYSLLDEHFRLHEETSAPEIVAA